MTEFLLGYLVGWLIGRFIMRLMLVRKAMQILEERGESINEDIGIPKVQHMKVETENGIMYLYDALTGKYFCQGDTVAELASRLKEIHHIRTSVLVRSGKDRFLFLDGTQKQL